MRRYGDTVGFYVVHHAKLAIMDEYLANSGQKTFKTFKGIRDEIVREFGISFTTHLRCATNYQALRSLPQDSGRSVQECQSRNHPGGARKVSKYA